MESWRRGKERSWRYEKERNWRCGSKRKRNTMVDVGVYVESRGLRNECRLHGSTVGTVGPQSVLSDASASRSLPHAAPTAMGEGVCPRLRGRPGWRSKAAHELHASGKARAAHRQTCRYAGGRERRPPRTGNRGNWIPYDGEAKHRHPVRAHRRGRRSVYNNMGARGSELPPRL